MGIKIRQSGCLFWVLDMMILEVHHAVWCCIALYLLVSAVMVMVDFYSYTHYHETEEHRKFRNVRVLPESRYARQSKKEIKAFFMSND